MEDKERRVKIQKGDIMQVDENIFPSVWKIRKRVGRLGRKMKG